MLDNVKKYVDKIDTHNKNKEPLISIIISSHNTNKEHIRKIIGSILIQTLDFNKLEVIFVVDKSSDTTSLDLIIEYTKLYPNVSLYSLKNSSGFGISCNVGLENAHGKYVMFLNDEGYYSSNACKVLYDLIEDLDVDVASGNYKDFNIKHITNNWKDMGITNSITKINNIRDYPEFLKLDLSICSRIYRKSFLDENKIEFKNFHIGEDKVFNLETLFKSNNIIFIDEVVYFYDTKDSNKTNLTTYNILTLAQVNKCCLKLYEKYAPNLAYIELNSINEFIKKQLFNTNLDFTDFEILVDEISILFKKFLENENTDKILEYSTFYYDVSVNDYVNSFKEYEKLKFNSGDKTFYDKLDTLENLLLSYDENNEVYDNFYNDMMDDFKSIFLNSSAIHKSIIFSQVKEFIYECIVKHNQDLQVRSNLNKNNLLLYNYIIMSINYDDKLLENIQSKINLNAFVSVIIYCNKNSMASELYDMLEVLIKQSLGFHMIEIVFVADNVSNNIHSILDEFVQVYYNVKYIDINGKITKIDAINYGIRNSTSPYLMFMDKDHIFLDTSIKNILKAIYNSNVNVVSGTIVKSQTPPDNTLIWTKIFRRKFIEEVNITFIQGMDNDIHVDDTKYDKKEILNLYIPVIK